MPLPNPSYSTDDLSTENPLSSRKLASCDKATKLRNYLPLEMNHQQLSPMAESLRQQIKKMITDATPKPPKSQYNETTVFEEDANGNKVYDGILLDGKVSELIKQMGLGEGWGWSLANFMQSRPLINKFSRMWLVPLSEKAIITPDVVLREGFCTLIVDQPTLSLDSTVIFIAPK